MDFFQPESAQSQGFSGFISCSILRKRKSEIPADQGVYLVFSPPGFAARFLNTGTGGFFKGIDPNVSTVTLAENWISGSKLLYIGKAGGAEIGSTLRARILALESFGRGAKIGHKGGRYLWQLANSAELLVCWRTTQEEPRQVKKVMMEEFRVKFGRWPFANLAP